MDTRPRQDTLRERYWLEDKSARIEIGPTGVLIGRSPECDVVIQDPYVSRHHAIVRLSATGPEVLSMGRSPVEHNGESAPATAALATGDHICVAGRTLIVRRSSVPQAPAAPPEGAGTWVIERGPGELFGINQPELSVGGGDSDDLVIQGWPAGALCVHLVQGAPVVEVRAPDMRLGDRDLALGELAGVGHGKNIHWRDQHLRFIALSHAVQHTTQVRTESPLPRDVELCFLPRGGRLFVDFGHGQKRALYLAERRCALAASLLGKPGDLIPDDDLCAQVWPRDPGKGRLHLNTLVFRLRNDLVKAGINGAALIERDAGGTRFCVGRGASVRVRTG